MIAAVVSALVVLLLGLSFLHVATGSNVSDIALDFSFDLINRDSPESPFHDPASTPFSHLHAATRRSTARANKFRHVASPNTVSIPRSHINISALIIEFDNEYLMRFYMGSEKTRIYAQIDTGSQLTWVLCNPCKKCYMHKGEVFNPRMSSSYEIVRCLSKTCNLLQHNPCEHVNSYCRYDSRYIDKSHAVGKLSIETLSFDSNPETTNMVPVPRIIIGCTHRTKGEFNSASIGIVGLSGHKLSLFRQLGRYTGNKFSYCLPSKGKSSQMYFGNAALVSGPLAVSTHLHVSDKEFLYYITLYAISIIDSQGMIFTIKLQKIASLSSNNMLIDTGITFTYLAPDNLELLIEELVKVIPDQRVKPPPEANEKIVLCYNRVKLTKLPKIGFEFEGGAKIVLTTTNIFVLVNDNTICLSIFSNIHTGGESILGTLSQKNHRIGIDLDAQSVTFLPEVC